MQLHAGFTFDDAAAAIPYLARLGISHVYCSPILQAAPGSTHGYDVTDHGRINDELGGASGFERLSRAAASHDIALVVDIVPNHMALAATNRWWWDVLEDGPASRYARHFDIDWSAGPTVLMPILGDQYGIVLEGGELELAREGGAFVVRYHDHELPLSPRSIDDIVRAAAARAKSDELSAIADRLAALPIASETDPTARRIRHEGKVAVKQDLRALATSDPGVADALDTELRAVATDADALDELLSRQNYRLAHWRVASDELDYRRFFDVTSLVGLRVEDDTVFDDTHALILDLVARGDVSGLRIDHVDGLRDPEAYLHRLRAAAPNTWIVVEKILAADESLPASWPIAGTTGYDFARAVSDLFVEPEGAAALIAHFGRFTGETRPFEAVAHEAQLQVLSNELAAEVERVTDLAMAVCRARRRYRDHTRRDIRAAVRELAAAMPVYRTYVVPGTPASTVDRQHVAAAIAAASERRPDFDGELLGLLGRVLVGDEPGDDAAELVARFQQLTAPATAKGIEDTALYRWVPLLTMNDVGSEPGQPGDAVGAFHAHNAAMAREWPGTMLALSTHDSKRSADVRARLAVLTELAAAWTAQCDRWRADNARHRPAGWDDPTMELQLYQSLVGAWPITRERLEAVLVKSANEAKVHTSWRDQDDDYLDGLRTFIGALLDDVEMVGSVERFLADHDVVARGHALSLAQVALELTVPGVPDTYQGDEQWRFDLVDPDNRRTVAVGSSPIAGPKATVLHQLLQHRRGAPHLYDTAGYAALAPTGEHAGDVVAFARETSGRAALVVVATCRSRWHERAADTFVTLPAGSWTSVLGADPPAGAPVTGPVTGAVAVGELLGDFPVAVLERQ